MLHKKRDKVLKPVGHFQACEEKKKKKTSVLCVIILQVNDNTGSLLLSN